MATSSAAAKGSSIFQKLKIGPMKRLYKYYTPNAINFAGGIPMESIFPFEEINVKCVSGSRYNLKKGSNLTLNYQRGDGIVDLRDWVQGHTATTHHRHNFSTCVSVGSTDALAKIYALMHGDAVLFDEYAYGAAVIACETLGRRAIGVAMDDQGMLPNRLRDQILRARAKGLNPDIVYLVPEAQNPTGATMSIQRKQEIYDVCQELDVVIVEDGV